MCNNLKGAPYQSSENEDDDFVVAGEALDRLINIALSGDHGGARRVADFLLAWWNGPDQGHFAVIEITYLDYEIGLDVLTILTFLNQYGVHYADAWDRRQSIEAIIDKWR